MPAPDQHTDPMVAAAGADGWRGWWRRLLQSGRSGLARLGLALGLGLATGSASLLLFAYLAGEVMEQETQRLDDATLAWLRGFSSPLLDLLARALSAMGSEVIAGLLVLLLGLFAVQRRWGAAVALLVVTGGAQLLNNVLKELFHRTRPAPVGGLIPAQTFSFPSGHAMVAAAFYLFLAYLGWRLLYGWPRVALTLTLLLLILGIGISRLYLGVHYLTDVAAGYLAGLLWTDAVIAGGRMLGHQRGRRSASRAPPGSLPERGEGLTSHPRQEEADS